MKLLQVIGVVAVLFVGFVGGRMAVSAMWPTTSANASYEERLAIQMAENVALHIYGEMKRLGLSVDLVDRLDTQYPGHPHMILEINEPVTSKDVDDFVVSFAESNGFVKEPYLHTRKAAAFFVQARDDVPGLDVMFTVEGPRRATFIVSVATKNPSVGALR